MIVISAAMIVAPAVCLLCLDNECCVPVLSYKGWLNPSAIFWYATVLLKLVRRRHTVEKLIFETPVGAPCLLHVSASFLRASVTSKRKKNTTFIALVWLYLPSYRSKQFSSTSICLHQSLDGWNFFFFFSSFKHLLYDLVPVTQRFNS